MIFRKTQRYFGGAGGDHFDIFDGQRRQALHASW
jgi:hypothetical protein